MATRLLMATAAALLATVSASYATPTITGSYTTSVTSSNHTYAPTVSDDLSANFSSTLQSLTPNKTSAQTDFITVAPKSGSSGVGTVTGTVSIQFSLTGPSGSAVTGVSTSSGGDLATFTGGFVDVSANYELFYGSNPQTDCIVWNATSCVANDSTALGETVTVSFADNQTLAINLYNWSDWDMSPNISFDLDPVTTVQEPTSITLLGAGLLGLFVVARRRGAAPAMSSLA